MKKPGLHMPPPPFLATLASKPSWVNRSNNTDRSACCEVRASELWRCIEAGHWKKSRSSSRNACSQRQAVARIIITARMLKDLHNHRMPRELIGDRRSFKSNVMKGRVPGSNPNKGASREKKLGLWGAGEIGFPAAGWSQELRVERWLRFPLSSLQSFCATVSVRASAPPRNQHFLICPGCETKVVKLFLPLTTQAEEDDAELAEGWVRLIEAHPKFRLQRTRDPVVRDLCDRIVNRYGLLFRGRKLLCRGCLGLKYGEIRRTRRLARNMDIFKNFELSRKEKAALRRLNDALYLIRRSKQVALMFGDDPASSGEIGEID
jgi:hypothetical protein